MSPLLVVLMGAALPCGLHTKPGRIEVGLYATFQDAPSAAVREAAREEWVSDGKVIPYTEIHCDALRAYLAHTLVSEQKHHPAVFGRALGRVLAHELYHILAKTKRHGTGGVGKESFTPAELTSDEFHFHDGEMRRVQLEIFGSHPPLCRASE